MGQDKFPRRRMLRTRDAAAYTGLAKSTLEKLRVYGGGCPYLRVGRAVLYDPADLDAWLAEHRRLSTSDPGPTRADLKIERK
jgi:excisionase family DNA binding protein